MVIVLVLTNNVQALNNEASGDKYMRMLLENKRHIPSENPYTIMFTAPYRICDKDCPKMSKKGNYMEFPIYIGPVAKKKYKNMYPRDFIEILKNGIGNPDSLPFSKRHKLQIMNITSTSIITFDPNAVVTTRKTCSDGADKDSADTNGTTSMVQDYTTRSTRMPMNELTTVDANSFMSNGNSPVTASSNDMPKDHSSTRSTRLTFISSAGKGFDHSNDDTSGLKLSTRSTRLTFADSNYDIKTDNYDDEAEIKRSGSSEVSKLKEESNSVPNKKYGSFRAIIEQSYENNNDEYKEKLSNDLYNGKIELEEKDEKFYDIGDVENYNQARVFVPVDGDRFTYYAERDNNYGEAQAEYREIVPGVFERPIKYKFVAESYL